jgi:hypothetical protein
MYAVTTPKDADAQERAGLEALKNKEKQIASDAMEVVAAEDAAREEAKAAVAKQNRKDKGGKKKQVAPTAGPIDWSNPAAAANMAGAATATTTPATSTSSSGSGSGAGSSTSGSVAKGVAGPAVKQTGPKGVRGTGIIEIQFTPRAFVTAARESHAQEEEEWLSKQMQARKAVAEAKEAMASGIGNDPLWLKDKGNEFFKQGNYQAALNAFTTVRCSSLNSILHSRRLLDPIPAGLKPACV